MGVVCVISMPGRGMVAGNERFRDDSTDTPDVSELRTQEPTRLRDTPTLHSWVLRHQHQGFQGFQSLTEHLALSRQRNFLVHDGTDPKELTHFIEGFAKA
jgi:hypothetical protein